MSIFVDSDALIDISIRYKEVKNTLGQIISIQIIRDDAQPQDDEKLFTCKARGRDFDTMSNILEDATFINHITGAPILRTKVLMPLIIEKFVVSWNQEVDGVMIPINNKTIGSMFHLLVRRIASKWITETSGK